MGDDIHIDDEVNAVKLAVKSSAENSYFRTAINTARLRCGVSTILALSTNVPTYFLTSKLKKRMLSACINGSFRNSDKRLQSVQNTAAR